MTLMELLSVVDNEENIQVTYRGFKNCKDIKRDLIANCDILEKKVKQISLEGSCTMFVEIE